MNLTKQQTQAIVLLLEGNDQASVAKLLDRNKSTIFRWTKLPAFISAMSEGRQAAFGDACTRLSSTSFRAACTLEELMDNSEKEEVRLKAATEILSYGLKLTEAIDHGVRLAEIEKALKMVDPDE